MVFSGSVTIFLPTTTCSFIPTAILAIVYSTTMMKVCFIM